MLAFIKGKIIEKGASRIVIEAAGVGFCAVISRETSKALPSVGKETTLLTFLQYKQEGTFELYGFATQEEKDLFELLLSVDKIGPKTALSIAGAASSDRIKSAIKLGKTEFLTKVVGVTERTAQRLIVELSGKIKESSKKPELLDADAQIEEALVALGFTKTQIRKALEKMDSDDVDFQVRMRQALRLLSGKK